MASVVVAQAIVFVPGTVFQHEGQIVEVGRDVGSVYRIEVLDLFTDFLTGLANSVCYLVFFLCMEADGEENKKKNT